MKIKVVVIDHDSPLYVNSLSLKAASGKGHEEYANPFIFKVLNFLCI